MHCTERVNSQFWVCKFRQLWSIANLVITGQIYEGPTNVQLNTIAKCMDTEFKNNWLNIWLYMYTWYWTVYIISPTCTCIYYNYVLIVLMYSLCCSVLQLVHAVYALRQCLIQFINLHPAYLDHSPWCSWGTWDVAWPKSLGKWGPPLTSSKLC